jgi:hypothetical protein
VESDDNSISRRDALSRVAAVPVALGLAAGATTEAEAAKLSQKAAAYQDKPKGKQECDGCRFFEKPNACSIVDGKISPKGWCKLFAAKGK